MFLYGYTSIMRTIDKHLQDDFGLMMTWYEILIMLEHAPDNRLTHSAIGEGVILTRSGVTRVIDRMVKEGLVAREQSTEDRRRSYVKMTPNGRKALDTAGPDHSQRVYDLFGKHLRAEEAPAVLSFLKRILSDDDAEMAQKRVHWSGPAK
jgi:DNA-binding MarR family transcriptional regulator